MFVYSRMRLFAHVRIRLLTYAFVSSRTRTLIPWHIAQTDLGHVQRQIRLECLEIKQAGVVFPGNKLQRVVFRK